MTRYFAARRVRGPAWNRSGPMRQQALWDAHAQFMNALAAEGVVVVLGGPIGGGGEEILLVIDAPASPRIHEPMSDCSRSHGSGRGQYSSTIALDDDATRSQRARSRV